MTDDTPATARANDNIATTAPQNNRPDTRRKKMQARRAVVEKRFKYTGLGAILLAVAFLMVLLSTVIGKAIPAFTHYYLNIPLDFSGHVNAAAPQEGDYKSGLQKGNWAIAALYVGAQGKTHGPQSGVKWVRVLNCEIRCWLIRQ